jgi:ribonuclease P protein component
MCFKKENSAPKFAFVVSKKTAKSAVERNSLRRRGFCALRNTGILKQENGKIGFIGAFFFKKEAKNLSFEEIKREIKILLEKSGVL